MANDVNAKLAKILGFPENVTSADIRMRPMRPPEVDLTYFIVDEDSIPKEIEARFKQEIEARFKLVEIVESDEVS